MRKVHITVTGEKTAETYLSKSYPSRDFDGNGLVELYRTPLYKVHIEGTAVDGSKTTKTWRAIRFAPYYNDPNNPNTHYKTRNWVNAGLHHLSKRPVQRYNPNYNTSNTPSPFMGSIQLRDHFLIHAGPETIAQWGWGSAGCVEVIGNFTDFKKDVASLSGSSETDVDKQLLDLVQTRHLYVEVQYATPPDFRRLVDQEIQGV